MSINFVNVAEKIFNILKGRGFQVFNYDEEGKAVADPADAKRFYVKSPNMLVVLDAPNSAIEFSAKKNTEHSDTIRQQLKSLADDFLLTMDYKIFGKTIVPKSDTVDIERSRMQENRFSKMSGSLKTSYQPLHDVRLIIKHNAPVDENVRGSRSRNISKIFVEVDGQRTLLSFKNLQGARAIARHLEKGGDIGDQVSEGIGTMVQDLSKLKEFVRYVSKQDLINEDNNYYVEMANDQISHIKTTLKKLHGPKTYESALQTVENYLVDQQDDADIGDKFKEVRVDQAVSDAEQAVHRMLSQKKIYQESIMSAIKKESFAGLKEMLSENEGIEFADYRSHLGHQVGQMSRAATDQSLSNCLHDISTKITNGGSLSGFDYRVLKSSLLAAQSGNTPQMTTPSPISESKIYENFLESFVIR